MTVVMSTSLKVVSIAAVFCASLRRRAMVWRNRVIGMRCSRVRSSGTVGARAAAGGGAGAGAGAKAARPSTAVSASALVTRPPLPVPATRPGSTPASASALRAAGDGVPAPLPVRSASRSLMVAAPAAIGRVVPLFSSGAPA